MKYLPGALSAIILLLTFFVSAQSNYKPGYIVTPMGDTVKGFIDYREWDKNPKQISFKAKPRDRNATDVTPANTAAFGVTGLEYYERDVVSVSMDPVDINKIAGKTDSVTMVTDTIFLKVLVSGKYASLYAFTDDLKPRFFYPK